MAILNGSTANADDIMNALGSNFNDTAQCIFNQAYIGLSSKLSGDGTLSLKNVFYNICTSDSVDVSDNFSYDSVNDLYQTADFSSIGANYVIITADDATVSWTNNDTQLTKIGNGKWILYGTAGTDNVKRAQIYKSLFYGTNGTDQLVEDFSNITSMQTSMTDDIGKRGHYYKMVKTGAYSSPETGTYTGTFANTSTNNGCSSWGKVYSPNATGSPLMSISMPSGTVLLSHGGSGPIDELGTDRTGDEADNPASIIASGYTGISTTGHYIEGIVLCSGGITWVLGETEAGVWTESDKDFYTDNNVPDFTAISGSLYVSTLIFKDTTSESVTNAIPIFNTDIDATSSQQISVSADSGSNYTDVDNAEIARPTAGTGLWRKIVITRTDLSKEDKVTEEACKYNLY